MYRGLGVYSIIRVGGAAACHRDRSAGGGVEPTRFCMAQAV